MPAGRTTSADTRLFYCGTGGVYDGLGFGLVEELVIAGLRNE
ncbi:hypothetical protein [Mycolicibacterium sp. P9-64]|nr:hypothetical protein [Mycolicibacterium sp. P9-64]